MVLLTVSLNNFLNEKVHFESISFKMLFLFFMN